MMLTVFETWLFSIITSLVLKKYNDSLIYKDLADRNYKINLSKYAEFNKGSSEDNKSNNTMTLFVPIVNIFSQIFNRKKMIDSIDDYILNFSLMGILEEMNDVDKKYYNKRKSLKRALDINLNPNLVNLVVMSDTLKDELEYDYVITYSYFDNGKNTISFINDEKSYKIVNSSGPISIKKKKEQKMKIDEMCDKVYTYSIEKNKDQDELEVVENITYDDFNEALEQYDESIDVARVLKKDLRKRR